MAKGFKGRYFSLAAIVATVSCVHLQATENRVQNHERQIAQIADHESEDDAEALEEIVVESALPSSSSLKNITSDVTVITSEELEEKHYLNLLDALRHQSSIFVAQSGGPGQTSGFFLNGMSSEHILVMIDGTRLNDPTSTRGQAQLEHIRLADVRQIEIIKGGQSGVWGPDASGGVINIVTNKATEGLHFDGYLEGGSYTSHSGSLIASYGTKRFQIRAGFDGFKTDGFPPKTTSTFDARDIERTYVAVIAFQPTDTTHLKANYRQVVSDYDYDSFGIKTPGSANLKYYNVSVDQKISDVLLNAYGWKSDVKRELDGNPYKGNEYEAGLKAHYEIGQGRYDLGFSHRKSKMQESYGTSLDDKMRDNAIFGSFGVTTLQDRLLVNVAMRYDNFDAFDDKTTGKIGMKYRFGNEFYAAANVGTAYRAPSLYERFGGDGYTFPNNDLKPESTTAYDVRIGGFGGKIGYFYNEITDLIDYHYNPDYTGYYMNVSGTSKIQGIEVSYERAVERLNSSLSLAYTYLDAKDSENRRLLRRPRHNVVAQWDLYATEKLHMNLNAHYVADYMDVRAGSWPPQNKEMGEYIVWNAVINYGNEKSGVYLKINNIFDEEYHVADGYNTEEQSIYAGWKFHY